MTAEVTFAKTFLSILDTKPQKLANDYAADLRSLEITFPYTLPRPRDGKPMARRAQPSGTSATDSLHGTTTGNSGAVPGSEAAISVSLKSLKNPKIDLTLPAEPLSTSILDLKRRVAENLGLDGTEKVRLLWRKKPVGDAKTLSEVTAGENVTGLELGVMVIGGVPSAAAAVTADESAETIPAASGVPGAQGETGEDVLMTDAFWSDLHSFLEQRVRDTSVAQTAGQIFQDAWRKGRG